MPRVEDDGLWQHPDWKTYKPGEDTVALGRKVDNINAVDSFIVQIQFVEVVNGRPELFTGNGFFLELPDLEDRHVVVTAASHLFVNNRRTTSVKVFYQVVDDQGNPEIVECAVDNNPNSNQVQIFNLYSSSGAPYTGYAAISILRASGDKPRGFGFSLKLSLRDSFGEFLYMSSFDNVVPTPPNPDTFVLSSATRPEASRGVMTYVAATEESTSGGAVWLEYEGCPTVIAIHQSNGSASCSGHLLTFEMFQDLFDWLNAGLLRTNIQISVYPEDIPPNYHTGERSIFLSFLSNTGFARVKLDSGSYFDWMLAEVGASGKYYVLSLAGRKEWVQFDVEAPKYQSVLLSQDLAAPGTFLQNTAGQEHPWVVLTAATFLLHSKSPMKVQLRVEGARLKAYDSARESSEVSLARVGATEASQPFYRFLMTDAPDTLQDGCA